MLVNNNCLYDKEKHAIYLKQDPRSASAFNASLRDLISSCKNLQIFHLTIIRDESCATNNFLKEIPKNKKVLEEACVKITVLKGVRRITDRETEQIILNDFHLLPTGGLAGINRMYNNVKKYYFWNGLRKDIEEFVRNDDVNVINIQLYMLNR